jgi:hypothetical protein
MVNKKKDTNSLQDSWIGKTLAELCQHLGNPDIIEPASYYSAIFLDAIPSVVLTYRSLGHRWFVSKDGYVQYVLRIKE